MMQRIKQEQNHDDTDLNSAATTATSPLQDTAPQANQADDQSEDEEGLPIGLIPNSLGEGGDGPTGD